MVAFIPPLSLSNTCSNRIGHRIGLVSRDTPKLRETPVEVYGVLDWLATSARDLLTPDIGHGMLRMQQPSSSTGTGLTSAAGQRRAICWRISDWPLLAAADTAGAEIADQFHVVMPPGMRIIVGAGA